MGKKKIIEEEKKILYEKFNDLWVWLIKTVNADIRYGCGCQPPYVIDGKEVPQIPIPDQIFNFFWEEIELINSKKYEELMKFTQKKVK